MNYWARGKPGGANATRALYSLEGGYARGKPGGANETRVRHPPKACCSAVKHTNWLATELSLSGLVARVLCHTNQLATEWENCTQ